MLVETCQFVGGLLITNAGEWIIHKHVLHGLGKRRGSLFSFHWNEHHRTARRNDFRDADYERSVFGWHSQGREAGLLTLLGIAVAPIGFALPCVLGGIWTGLTAYYVVHKRAHLHPEWAKKWVPWHVDHHMGKNQDSNWCVTWPIWDVIMSTREKR